MKISSKGRAAVAGSVVLAIVTQAAVASAFHCEFPWARGLETCSNGTVTARGNGINLDNGQIQIVADLRTGRHAEAVARDAQGNLLCVGTPVPSDTRPSDGRFALTTCRPESPPQQLQVIVN